MDEEYTTFDIEKIFGIKHTRFREWIDRGFITPSIQASSGRGSKALFSREDLDTIYTFKKLLEFGFSRSVSKNVVNTIRGFRKTGSLPIRLDDFMSITLNTSRISEVVEAKILVAKYEAPQTPKRP